MGSQVVIHMVKATGEEMKQKSNLGEILGEDK